VRHAPQLSPKWLPLYVAGRPARNIQPLTAKDKLVQLDAFELTGPEPGHPFVLGNFVSDGQWGIVAGGVQRTGGKNAVLELARGDQFELQGVMEQIGLGGWFLLIGWDDGHGYCLSNVLMKESGAPWFLTEFPSFEWQREQPFQLQVADNKLTFNVGQTTVLEQQELKNYQPGAVILGTYDTRYGPRGVRLTSLRGRALKLAE